MKRQRERFRKKHLGRMENRRQQVAQDQDQDQTHNAFVPPLHEPLVDVGNRCCAVPRKVSLSIPCCRRAATEEYIVNARRRYDGEFRYAPRYRARIAIDDYAHFIPHAMMVALPCCRVATSESEQRAWRARHAIRAQREDFKPQRRLSSVMVFVMYILFPTLVASAAGMFNCSDTIDGKRYLLVDLTVTCYEGWHIVYLVAASVAMVVYCFGTCTFDFHSNHGLRTQKAGFHLKIGLQTRLSVSTVE